VVRRASTDQGDTQAPVYQGRIRKSSGCRSDVHSTTHNASLWRNPKRGSFWGRFTSSAHTNQSLFNLSPQALIFLKTWMSNDSFKPAIEPKQRTPFFCGFKTPFRQSLRHRCAWRIELLL
jgi:hypothetical protein